MLVPSARHLVPLRDLDPIDAAPLTDAGLTPYHAVKRSLSLLGPGSVAVVIGVGGLGHMAVQILEALTPTRIVAVDARQPALDLATAAGAAHTVITSGSTDELAATIGKQLDGAAADVVLDFVGVDGSLALAARLVRPLGHLTIVGLGGGTLPLGFFSIAYEAAVATTYWGSVTELMEVVELAEAGKIKAQVTRYPLERAMDAYDAMQRGELDGRAVIVPG
jgi:propanol-preferring alcohol dehydrogenase